ncbi:MAG: hypothetical protein DLM70_02380, partial [Chloroflexi bacterium]
TAGTATTGETWDVAEGLPLLVQDGSTSYVTGVGGVPLEQIGANSTVYYYYQDQLGSTRALLDGSGNTVDTYAYNPYGNLSSSTGSVANPFKYAGQYTDAESGLQYCGRATTTPAPSNF